MKQDFFFLRKCTTFHTYWATQYLAYQNV